jgi:TonB family protein
MRTIGIIIMAFIFIFNIKGQCDIQLKQQIDTVLKKENFIYLKDFEVNLVDTSKIMKYSIVLSKQTTYRFYLLKSNKYKNGEAKFKVVGKDITQNPIKTSSLNSDLYFYDLHVNNTDIFDVYVERTSSERFCGILVLAYFDEKKLATEKSGFDESEVFFVVEKMPQFIKGDNDNKAFIEWINKNLKYPVEAAKAGISGKVYLSFIVDSKGKVGNIKVVKSVHPLLDEAALNLIKSCPDWEVPGYQRGHAVNVMFSFPIIFKLQ